MNLVRELDMIVGLARELNLPTNVVAEAWVSVSRASLAEAEARREESQQQKKWDGVVERRGLRGREFL